MLFTVRQNVAKRMPKFPVRIISDKSGESNVHNGVVPFPNTIPLSSPTKMGVFKENELEDITSLVHNFTAPALARALREREAILQSAAVLAAAGNWQHLSELLLPFMKENVVRRRVKNHDIDFSTSSGLTRMKLVILQRYLHKMPRHVFKPVDKRASVVIPLCNVNGIASVLFERRSSTVRTHKQQGECSHRGHNRAYTFSLCVSPRSKCSQH